jgi:hypothetical protein
MNRRVRALLRGMSTASLIMAWTLPALGQFDPPPPTCPTRSKTKQVESSKDKAAKDSAGAKKKVDKTPSEKAPKTKERSAK